MKQGNTENPDSRLSHWFKTWSSSFNSLSSFALNPVNFITFIVLCFVVGTQATGFLA